MFAEKLILLPTPHLVTKHWQVTVNRADPRLVDMYERHYSCYRYADGRSRNQAIAPGQYIAVMTANLDALFVWQKSKYRADKQDGINCAVFRNEGAAKSSLLIQEAMELAWLKWGYQRLFTFVDARKIKSSNPGYCFKMAGWQSAGVTKTGLLIFEYLKG
jgi:hypothetical protein